MRVHVYYHHYHIMYIDQPARQISWCATFLHQGISLKCSSSSEMISFDCGAGHFILRSLQKQQAALTKHFCESLFALLLQFLWEFSASASVRLRNIAGICPSHPTERLGADSNLFQRRRVDQSVAASMVLLRPVRDPISSPLSRKSTLAFSHKISGYREPPTLCPIGFFFAERLPTTFLSWASDFCTLDFLRHISTPPLSL